MSNLPVEFQELFGEHIKVIATIDHPYTSPPIHLFDGHLKLLRQFNNSVMVLNWDVSVPDDRFYRYDLTTDTGFIAKQSSLFHYEPKLSYCLQKFGINPWRILQPCVECAIKEVQFRHKFSDSFTGDLLNRALEVVKQSEIISSSSSQPSQYTFNTIKSYYEKLNQYSLKNFLESQYFNYWKSPLTRIWIPRCLESVQGNMSFSVLLSKGLFKRTPFRSVSVDSINTDLPTNTEKIAEMVSRDLLIPSLDVFLWSLAVAKIRHYGNDFNFFANLGEVVGDSTLASLQVTGDEEDCSRFLKFEADYGILLEIDDKIYPSKRINHPHKLTRVTNFHSVFVALGSQFEEILNDFATGKFKEGKLTFDRKSCYLKMISEK